MNYLAHCLLAPPSPEGLIGSLAPDFSRPHDYAPPHPLIQAAMREHHAIDAFTDSHPLFLRSRARFRTRYRHYAGALTDIVYDHVLARNWDAHHPRAPLSTFAAGVYETLATHAALCPPVLREALPRMREQNWLAAYATREGLKLTLERIAHRLKSHPDFSAVLGLVEEHRIELNQEFEPFFSDLKTHLHDFRNNNSNNE